MLMEKKKINLIPFHQHFPWNKHIHRHMPKTLVLYLTISKFRQLEIDAAQNYYSLLDSNAQKLM